MQSNPKWRVIGTVTRSHGLRGHVIVYPLTDFPERFRKGASVNLLDAKGKVYSAVMAECAPFKNGFRILFDICKSVDDAERLRSMQVVVDYDDRMEMPDEDTFYIDDIVGMEVHTEDGKVLGCVTEVISNPANDIYCIGDVMIPAVSEFILNIDMQKKTILVHLIPGMLPEDDA